MGKASVYARSACEEASCEITVKVLYLYLYLVKAHITIYN